MVCLLPTALDVNNSTAQSLLCLIDSYDCPGPVLQFIHFPIGLTAWNAKYLSEILTVIVLVEDSSDVQGTSIVWTTIVQYV